MLSQPLKMLRLTWFLSYLEFENNRIVYSGVQRGFKGREDKEVDYHTICLPSGLLLQWALGSWLRGAPERVSKSWVRPVSLKLSFHRENRLLELKLLESGWPLSSQGHKALDSGRPGTRFQLCCFHTVWAEGKPSNLSDSRSSVVQRETIESCLCCRTARMMKEEKYTKSLTCSVL